MKRPIQRFLSSWQRRVKPSIDGVLASSERVFYAEPLFSASVLFLPVLYMTAALALLTRVGLGSWVLPAGVLLWAAAVAALHRQEGRQRLAATLLLFLAAFAFAAFLTSLTLDGGFDSRFYHARSVLQLLDGDNPYYHPEDWAKPAYPAAHWLVSSSLVVWTQSFEASFALTLAAAFAAFLCARRFLVMLGLKRPWRGLFAFLLAMSPVTVWCFFTHHTDGLLASALLISFMLMTSYTAENEAQHRKARRRTAILIAATLVLLVNIKFTGLVYGGVLGFAALVYGLRRRMQRKRLVQLARLGCASAIVGVVLFGLFPYATNTLRDKDPFSSTVRFDKKSGEKTDVVGRFFESEFYNKSSYEKWWISLFSETGKNWNEFAPLPPFSSLRTVSFLGGFGSLFSGSTLLCLTLVFFVRHKGAWVVSAGIMASVLATKAGFYPRLAPQIWWLPLLFLVFLLAPDKRRLPLSRAQKAVVFFVVACLLYVSVFQLRDHGRYAVRPSSAVTMLEKQGGWFVAPDAETKHDRSR